MTIAPAALLFAAAIHSALPQITVVYPRPAPGDTAIYIDRVDSNFVFGTVMPADAGLMVNGVVTSVQPDCTYLAFVLLDWQKRYISLRSWVGVDTTEKRVVFNSRPAPPPPKQPYLPLPRRVLLSGGAARTAPNGAYYLFPDSGAIAYADRWQDGLFRLPLTNDRAVWLASDKVTDGGSADPPKPQVVWKGDITIEGRWEILHLPLADPTLYRITDSDAPNRIVAELFGVVSHLDRIHYPPGLKQISEVIWDQPEENILRLEVALNGHSWGYKIEWREDGFRLAVRRPPQTGKKLHGLCIVIDPGHGGSQAGAIGPAGMMEKDINLAVALKLAEMMRKRGAEVILTRSADTTLGLTERVALADSIGADILVSVHHNALPDGANPFADTLGPSTRYYHPQSRDLAWAVQREIVRALNLPDEGVYYDNLALARPPFCLAILIEAAYIMLPEQERRMSDPRYPERLANAIADGIVAFVRDRSESTTR